MKHKDLYTAIHESIKLDSETGFMAGFMTDGQYKHMTDSMNAYAIEIAINTVAKYLGNNVSVLYEEYITGAEIANSNKSI